MRVMSFKNNMADLATMSMRVSQAKNRAGRYAMTFLAILFFPIALIAFLFSWKAGLVCLGISAFFFAMTKLSKYTEKSDEEAIEKVQGMKDNETI